MHASQKNAFDATELCSLDFEAFEARFLVTNRQLEHTRHIARNLIYMENGFCLHTPYVSLGYYKSVHSRGWKNGCPAKTAFFCSSSSNIIWGRPACLPYTRGAHIAPVGVRMEGSIPNLLHVYSTDKSNFLPRISAPPTPKDPLITE